MEYVDTYTKNIYKTIRKKSSTETLKVFIAVSDLLFDIAKRYDVKLVDDFKCPYVKELAKLVNFEVIPKLS